MLDHAYREVLAEYGIKLNVWGTTRTLHKFGRTTNADSGVKTTVGTFQGTVVNETFVTTNSIDSIASSDAGDTEVVTVEGHFYDAGNKLIPHKQDITLTGQTPVLLSQTLCRVNRIKVKTQRFAAPASDLAGNIYVYDATAATGATDGVPIVAAATKIMITAGDNQTEKCAISVGNSECLLISSMLTSLSRAAAATVSGDIDIEIREQGGAWRPCGLQIDLQKDATDTFYLPFAPTYIVAPPNSDVKMVGTTNTNNTTVSGFIRGLIVNVI